MKKEEEKEVMFLSYKYSGAKTSKGVGIVMLVISWISLVACAIVFAISLYEGYSHYRSNADVYLQISIYLAASFFAGLISGAACLGLSKIVEVNLYRKSILESKYEFIDNDKSNYLNLWK
jgi:hypothetical protein